MNRLLTMTCAAVAAVLTATALDYPVYTVTTSGEGTNDLSSAQVEVVSAEGATPETVAFSSLTLSSGTFRKKGTGFLMSADGMASFTGTVLVEEGAWIGTKLGHFGKSESSSKSSVVISNGASIIVDIPTDAPSGTYAAFRHNFTFEGTGYKNLGAIFVNYPGKNNQSHSHPLFRNATWKMTNDATIGLKHLADSQTKYYITYYISFNMNGHTLTVSGMDETSSSTYCILYSVNSTFSNPGDIVLDSARWRYVNDGTESNSNYTFTGSSANTLTVKGGDGNKTRNDSWLITDSMAQGSPWTLKIEDEGTIRASTGDWGTTNSIAKAGWAGHVQLVNGLGFLSSNSGKSFTLPNMVYGNGGLQCTRGLQINLINAGNSFGGELRMNTNRDAAHDGELRVFWNGALPKDSAGATLYNSDLTLMYSHDYQLPLLTFDVADGKTKKFSGGTNGVVRSFKKTGAGVLDMTSPLTVTGVTELAGGTLRLPCDRAGLIFGWRVQEGNASEGASALTPMLTNRVEQGANLVYTDDMVEWQRFDSNVKRLFTYHGYIWNRTNAAQTWTFAAQITQGMQIYIDRVKQNWTDVSSWYGFYNDKKVGFMTFNNVAPGFHQIDVRMYTGTDRRAWGTVANRWQGEGVSGAPTNATWQADLGLAIDRQGRGSTNYADYEKLVDPGDGSFLTVVPGDAENAEGVIAHMPKFDHLKFTGGTLDVRGSDITVPVLEGVNGAVTNSNAYYPGGSLTVGQKWIVSGADTANKTLNVTGKLKFAVGSVLEGADLALLSRTTEHALATATGGIEGLPAFDNNAPGYKGWHLVKVTENGVESLKLFWRLGTKFVIR